MNKVILFVLLAFQLHAQDTIFFPKIDVFKRNIIEVSFGKPLGQLADKYESSINTAYYMRTKVAKRQYIDFGMELSALKNGNEIEYEYNGNKVVLDGSKSGLLLGFRYTRFLFQSKNEEFHIETNTGLGWKYIHYSKPEDKSFDEVDLQPRLNTIAVTQGFKMMYYGFGIHCNYQYSPYGLFNTKAGENFGASSINYGISGSWNF